MRISKLLMPAVTLAGALALAGCGGGGGTTAGGQSCPTGQTGTPPNCVTPAQKALADATAAVEKAEEAASALGVESTSTTAEAEMISAARDMVEDLPDGDEKTALLERLDDAQGDVDVINRLIASEEDSGLLQIAETLIEHSQTARTAHVDADALLKKASDLSKEVSVTGAKGNSQTAYDNTLEVLKVRSSIDDEYEAAKDAVEKLKAIKTDDLDDDGKAAVALAIKNAEADQKAIKDILEAKHSATGSLASAERTVKTGAKTDDTDEEVAELRAAQVARAITTQLTTRAASTAANTVITTMGDNAAVTTTPNSGVRFSDIEPTNIFPVTDLDGRFFAGPGTTEYTGTITDGQGAQVNYNGIPGRLFCSNAGSAGCTFDSEEKVTNGSVVFQPDDRAALYHLPTIGATRYELVTDAASYGYWLNSSGNIVLHANSLTLAGNRNELLWTADTTPASTDDPLTATYSGDASGYSQRKTGTGTDAKHASGEFTASVELRAEFPNVAGDTVLNGSITGFAAKEGTGTGHVNPNWAIDLDDITFGTDGLGDDGGDISDNYRSGEVGATGGSWTANAYGSPVADEDVSATNPRTHPTGFVGAFGATFGGTSESGSAVGVYHAD